MQPHHHHHHHMQALGAVPLSAPSSGRVSGRRSWRLGRCRLPVLSGWSRILPRAGLDQDPAARSSAWSGEGDQGSRAAAAAAAGAAGSAAPCSPSSFVQVSSVWTASLILTAVLASKLTGLAPKLEGMLLRSGWDVAKEVGVGVLFTIPLALAGLALQTPWLEALVPGIESMKRYLIQNAKPILAECSTLQLVVLAAQAGLGEEILFRGFLQPFLSQISGNNHVLAILCSSVLFGLGHNVTASYMLISASFSAYLGWISLATNSLISPIVAHALYDFIAFYQVIHLK